MTFADHMHRTATEAVSSIPTGDAHDIYVLSFWFTTKTMTPGGLR